MLYLIACGTGFRASELASLTVGRLVLDGATPMIVVEAGYSKRRRQDEQPTRPDLAQALATYLESRQTAGNGPQTLPIRLKGSKHNSTKTRLWPGTWHERAAVMLSRDLERAGIPYADEAGPVVDFNALRHS